MRILLDTNIYGEMLIDPDIEKIRSDLERTSVIIYGMSIIRKELRATPKGSTFSDGNLRTHILNLYDNVIGKHELRADINKIKELADAYYLAYRNFGGSKSKDKVINDFLIVSNASIKGMDIVVSEDEKTMRSENAEKSYSLVNKIKKNRMPKFIGYEDFKKIIKK